MMFIKYFEMGLVLIPIKRANKNPAIEGWSKYCSTKPTEKELERWEKSFRSCNYGLPLGPANNLVALDIDTDNPETLKLCPQSPVVKRGKKGETRFFKYSQNVRTTKNYQRSYGVEILSNGTQTVIPPSIHPETKKPYVWMSKDTLENFEIDDLPTLDISFLRKLPRIDGLDFVSKEISQGRNDKLKEMAVAALNNFKSIDEIVEELVEYDKKFHPIPLFSDKKEGFNLSVKENAKKFVASIQKSVTPKLPKIKETEIDFSIQEKPVKISLPEPSGVLKEIKDYVDFNSIKNQSEFSLATALHILSVFACGRYKFKRTHPNLFSFVLGEPGSGKDDIVKQTKNILLHDRLRQYNLLGHGKYASAVALCQNLGEQRSRLDVCDEASSFFIDSAKKEGHGSAVLTCLNELYSAPGKFFSGPALAITRKEKLSCESPFVSFIGLIQPEMFIQKVTQDHLENGFISRCLFFQSNEDSKLNLGILSRDDADGLDHLVSMIEKLFPEKEILTTPVVNLGQKLPMALLKPKPKEIASEKDVSSHIEVLFKEYDTRRKDFGDNSIKMTLCVRALENIIKIAILDAISDSFGTKTPILRVKNLEWAQKLVDTQMSNNLSILEQAGGPKGQALVTMRTEEYFKEKKQALEIQYHSYFGRKGYSLKQRQEALKDLSERGLVEKFSTDIGSRSRVVIKYSPTTENVVSVVSTGFRKMETAKQI